MNSSHHNIVLQYIRTFSTPVITEYGTITPLSLTHKHMHTHTHWHTQHTMTLTHTCMHWHTHTHTLTNTYFAVVSVPNSLNNSFYAHTGTNIHIVTYSRPHDSSNHLRTSYIVNRYNYSHMTGLQLFYMLTNSSAASWTEELS